MTAQSNKANAAPVTPKTTPTGPTPAERLAALRAEMVKAGVDAFLQSTSDEFLNEYTPAATRRLPWLTDFTGSTGEALVTASKAAMSVDGRYTLQAANETDPNLYGVIDATFEARAEFLAANLKPGAVIGYDARIYSVQQVERWRQWAEGKGFALKPIANPIDTLWKNRPALNPAPYFSQSVKYAGRTAQEKISLIAQSVGAAAGEDAAYFIAESAAVNWLLNVRGWDEVHTPLALGHALVTAHGKVLWFTDVTKVTPALKAELPPDVTPVSLADMDATLKNIGGRLGVTTLLYDTAQTTAAQLQALASSNKPVKQIRCPIQHLRATKNASEIAGMREAHLYDAVALTSFLAWWENVPDVTALTELDIVAKLTELRKAASPTFHVESFPSIVGGGPNGAIVHYRPGEPGYRLKADEMVLVDSGGQYTEGTTDITRVLPPRQVSPEQRRFYTLVLKAHIALARTVFPYGTTGHQLDALARAPLWQEGLDFAHGTGHGVGAFLGVHEGPQRISTAPNTVPLEPGMVVSIEPGYYATGKLGIRIENLVVVEKADGKGDPAKPFFRFSPLTLVPFARELIDAAMLDANEKAWLDAYHREVNDKVSPRLPAPLKPWLDRATAPL